MKQLVGFKSAIVFKSAMVLIAGIALAGCTPVDTSESCDSSVGAVTPIERFEGMEYLTSSELADTLSDCADVTAWMSALRAHTELVGLDEISEADAEVYLASTCQLLPEKGRDNEICGDAVELGFFIE